MTTITQLQENDNGTVSRWVINTNFDNLNTDKQEILTEWTFVDWDKTKLDNIEAWAEVNTLNDVTAWSNVTIDKTNPLNPIINATWGGWGAVNSVNGKIWVVVLGTWDITEVTNKNYVTDAEKTTISNTSWTNTWDETAWSIKTKYESNADTNVFTDAEKTKLSNVDNTSDADKPVSTAQQTALDLKTNNTDSVTSVAWTPTWADRISKVVSLTNAEYTAATKIADTLYIITDA